MHCINTNRKLVIFLLPRQLSVWCGCVHEEAAVVMLGEMAGRTGARLARAARTGLHLLSDLLFWLLARRDITGRTDDRHQKEN